MQDSKEAVMRISALKSGTEKQHQSTGATRDQTSRARPSDGAALASSTEVASDRADRKKEELSDTYLCENISVHAEYLPSRIYLTPSYDSEKHVGGGTYGPNIVFMGAYSQVDRAGHAMLEKLALERAPIFGSSTAAQIAVPEKIAYVRFTGTRRSSWSHDTMWKVVRALSKAELAQMKLVSIPYAK